MTDEELEAIEERANAATPGPWDYGQDPYAWIGPKEGDDVVTSGTDEGGCDRLRDRVFIAHARTDIPALIAEVRRLIAENARMIRLQNRQHTDHCLKRQKFGDGECECGVSK